MNERKTTFDEASDDLRRAMKRLAESLGVYHALNWLNTLARRLGL